MVSLGLNELTQWGQLRHICVSKLTIIGWDNGLSPGRHQAIIWTNIGILLIRPLGTNLSEIPTFSLKKIHLKISSVKWQPFCLGLNVLTGSSLLVTVWCLFGAKPFNDYYWFDAIWTFRNKLKWNLNGNTKYFSKRNGFQNMICEMSNTSSNYQNNIWWLWYQKQVPTNMEK